MSTVDEPEGSTANKSDLVRLDLDDIEGYAVKKTGLAKLAKARDISGQSSTTNSTLSSPSITEISPLRGLSKQSTGVILLPNKMNVSSLSQESSSSGDQRRSQDSSPGTEITVTEYTQSQVPCSDPELVRNSSNRSSQKAARVLGIETDNNTSPLLSRRNRLAPPKVKRSNSLTHLTSAINQIHNMCIFAAHPTAEQATNMQSRSESSKSSEKLPGGILSEVIDHSILLPLMATSVTRTDQVCTSSPKLFRQPAFREGAMKLSNSSVDLSFVQSVDSELATVLNSEDSTLVVHRNGLKNVDHSANHRNNSLPETHRSSLNLEEAAVMNAFLLGSKMIPSNINSNIISSKAPSNPSELCNSVAHSNRPLPSPTSVESFIRSSIRRKSKKRHCDPLRNVTTAPQALTSHEQNSIWNRTFNGTNQSGRPKSWDGKEDDERSSVMTGSSETSPFSGHRSASMDELSNISGLPPINPSDAKQKSLLARGFSITRNYLFGGLGSLLGATELDRYFPNRTMNIFIATWNMNGKEPPAGLEEFLLPDTMEQVPDMYVIGTQESGGDRTEWEIRLQGTIGPSHVLFSSTVLGVLQLAIYLRRDLLWFCSVPEDASYSLRPGTYWKTKGCVAIGFQFFGTRMLFISSHLTAHEEKQAQRIQNFKSITQSLDLPRVLPQRQKHKNVTHRYDCTFWMGDLNFRLAVNRDHVLERLQNADVETYQHLLQWDQLTQARLKGEAFKEFEEGRITFPPTFKYDPGTDHYDTSSKQRVPSFTDRILYRCARGGINCIRYDSCPLFRTSDHKPVWGVFTCKIRPGKDDVPLAAGLFNRDVYLEALRRRRRYHTGRSSKGCPVQ